MTNPHLEAALAYAANGWPVFPCHGTTPAGACTCRQPACGSAGKHPAVPTGLHAATTDLDQIERWWHRRPNTNIGIRTGTPSGLVIVDIDPDHGGDTSWHNLQAAHAETPTATVATGGGGTHRYYLHPGTTIPNSASRIGPGIDIRGDGGYVIAPPSRHPSGHTYQWETGTPPQPLPGWLRHAALPPPTPRPTRPAQPVVAGDRWARAAAEGELQRVRTAPEGTRNTTLNRSAFRLGQIAATGLLDPDATYDHLVGAAIDAGLTPTEAECTTRSGLEAGQQHPRGPTVSCGLGR